MKRVNVFGAVMLAVLATPLTVNAEAVLQAVLPDQIPWKEIRKEPPLARAFIQGDQDKPGAFTFRVRAAAGHKLLPHTHPDDRVITVIEGTYWSAVGDVFDESKLVVCRISAPCWRARRFSRKAASGRAATT